MERKVKYTNEPLGKLKVIKDFLPSPSELVDKASVLWWDYFIMFWEGFFSRRLRTQGK
jgi:hypothetical protein